MIYDKKILNSISNGKGTKEGFMFFKTNRTNDSGFKEKWFKLRANLLFYYGKTPPLKTESPQGVMLMENFMIIKDNDNMPNTFTIIFLAQREIKHMFFCMNSRQSEEWFNILSTISYRQKRIQLNSLRSQIKELTNKDPLESTNWQDKT